METDKWDRSWAKKMPSRLDLNASGWMTMIQGIGERRENMA
jgi:hypothetical protein